jgi:ribosomal protein L24
MISAWVTIAGSMCDDHDVGGVQKRLVKATAEGEENKYIQKESPIHHSNVMLYSKEKGVASRVGYK